RARGASRSRRGESVVERTQRAPRVTDERDRIARFLGPAGGRGIGIGGDREDLHAVVVPSVLRVLITVRVHWSRSATGARFRKESEHHYLTFQVGEVYGFDHSGLRGGRQRKIGRHVADLRTGVLSRRSCLSL